MKKILYITPKYELDFENAYLTNDLVNELVSKDCCVDVISYGKKNSVKYSGNLNEYIIKLSSNIKYIKYFFAWVELFFVTYKLLFGIEAKNYDRIVMFAPLSVMWPSVILCKFLPKAVKIAIIFDIYPKHQVQIGSINKYIYKPLKFFEMKLMEGIDYFTCMGSNNKIEIIKEFTNVVNENNLKIIRLWCKSQSHKELSFNDLNDIRMIFGGQIIKGRDIDSMIDFFAKYSNMYGGVTLDIYSSGADFLQLKSKYSSFKWLNFIEKVPRNTYKKLLSSYDIGLIITDNRVTLPTYPSKVLDYIEAGLACYCIVEDKCDLSDLSDVSRLIKLNYFNFSESELHNFNNYIQGLSKVDGEDINYVELLSMHSVSDAANKLIRAFYETNNQ